MSLPTCPSNCIANLPALLFSLCAPEVNNAQISKIFFTTVGNPLTNWQSAVEWDSRLDNGLAGAAEIRTLIVVGELPIPTKQEKEISLGRIIEGIKERVINFDVDETNQTNHNALRALECNTGNVLIWFETRDHLLFGGNSGIEGKLSVDMTIPKTYNDIILYSGTFKWKHRFTPERVASPITNDTGNQF
jgi:hypothetical protein